MHLPVAFPCGEPWRQQPRARCHGVRSAYRVHHDTRMDTPRCTSADNAAYRLWRSAWNVGLGDRGVRSVTTDFFSTARLYSLEVTCIALYCLVLGASVSNGRQRQKLSGVHAETVGRQRRKVTPTPVRKCRALPQRNHRRAPNACQKMSGIPALAVSPGQAWPFARVRVYAVTVCRAERRHNVL